MELFLQYLHVVCEDKGRIKENRKGINEKQEKMEIYSRMNCLHKINSLTNIRMYSHLQHKTLFMEVEMRKFQAIPKKW